MPKQGAQAVETAAAQNAVPKISQEKNHFPRGDFWEDTKNI